MVSPRGTRRAQVGPSYVPRRIRVKHIPCVAAQGLRIDWPRSMTRLLAVAAAGLLVAVCGPGRVFGSAAGDAAPTPADLAALVPSDGRLSVPLVRSGVEALSRGDYVRASKALGRAIKLDPQDGALHFLNGLAYHLRAAAGDGSQYQLAEVGYHLALQFSPTLYVASTQVGRLQFSQGRVGGAPGDGEA